MTATLADVRTAIADTVGSALPGVNVYRLPVDKPVAPCVIVAGRTTVPDTTDGLVTDTWDVYAAVAHQHSDMVDELDVLTDQTGDGSAVAAIIADPSLAGVVQAATVISVGDYRELVMNDLSFYAATITVKVMR